MKLFPGVLCALVAMGCQGMADVFVEKEKGGGDSRQYAITEDQAWVISRHVLRWEGAEAVEERRDEGYMTCTFGINLVSYGSLAGVWIEKSGEEAAKVTVVCKRRMATDFATVMTEGTFHRWFAKAVDMLKAGKTLPKTRPTE
jgi:hypothetical protein